MQDLPPLRVVQDWEYDTDGKPCPVFYTLQYKDDNGIWKNIPIINRWPEPKQMELPLEDRPRS